MGGNSACDVRRDEGPWLLPEPTAPGSSCKQEELALEHSGGALPSPCSMAVDCRVQA